MEVTDIHIEMNLQQEFTSVKHLFEKVVIEKKLKTANLVCWVPHEVGSLNQIGWESGLIEDFNTFLKDIAPPGKWVQHDEPGTPFRQNFFEHIRTKLVGTVSLTLLVKDEELYLGKYQDLYYYSPVYKQIPNQMIFCRILKFN